MRSLEQFIDSERTEQFLVFNRFFLTCSWRFLRSNKLEQSKFKFKNLHYFSGTSTTIQRSSAPISAQFATKESEPGALTSFEPEEVQPSHITFQWDLPEANGIITGFVIEYYPAQSEPLRTLDQKVFKKDFSAHERSGTIENLVPGVRYIFKIKANTRVGSGKETQILLLQNNPSNSTVFQIDSNLCPAHFIFDIYRS